MAESPRLSFDPIAEAERQWVLHGWPDHASGMAVVTSIMRLQQIFLARADAVLRPLGLTFARYEVLMLLSFSRQGTLPLGKIGERLQVNAASVTNAVDRLQADGLVTRQSNPDDGRGRLARLTAAGRQTAAAATVVMNDEVFADIGLAPPAVDRLFDLLAELRGAAGDFEWGR
jgi:DNA-binding MarR family transcriptional regulator